MQNHKLYKTFLKERDIIQITGEEKFEFLQGLITNNIYTLSEKRVIYAALLTPQGKYLFDFILFLKGNNKEKIFFDCEKKRSAELINLLNMYKLRKKISISRVNRAKVYVVFGKLTPSFLSSIKLKNSTGFAKFNENQVAFLDPRNKNLGIRIILFSKNLTSNILDIPSVYNEEWNFHRLSLGIPDGSNDMDINKSFLIENNIEYINGIDFNKGCYLGQENTARQKYRGKLKKRLMKVKIHGNAVPKGTSITNKNKIVGLMHSSSKDIGLATIKIKEAKNAILQKHRFSAADSYLEVKEKLK